jgi:phospholipase/carboxylesterase
MRIVLGLILLLTFPLFSQKVNTTLNYSVHAPAVVNSKTPVLIMLHGYGSNEADLFSFASQMNSSCLVFSLRGPMPAGNNGYCWYPIDFLPNQQFRYDYKIAAVSRDKILSFISNACCAYRADSTNVYLIGFSQGAIMSYELSLFAPGKIKGVIALSGRLMPETGAIKSDPKKVQNVSFFIAHGKTDNIIRYDDGASVTKVLVSKGATDVSFRSYDMAHTITPAELGDIRQWFSEHLKKAGAPKK